ncbi:MAG: histidine phosphatase family protein [Acidaminococcales bacterium]|nr:histidine phosphatase family protein [Acidaminococcales bacterium]
MIILVRHGEARHHVDDLTGGWTDSSLTEKGYVQIEQAAGWIEDLCSGQKPAVITSDLLRAKQSARIIAGRLGSEIIVSALLREKNNGQAAGKTVQAAMTMRLPRQADDPDNRNYPGGETRREFFERVIKGTAQLLLSDKPFFIVAHKGTIQNILFWWLGFSIDEACRRAVSFAVSAASITVLTVNAWKEHEISLLNYRRDLLIKKVNSTL